MDPQQGYGIPPPPQHMGRDSQVYPQQQQQNTTVVVTQPGVHTNPLLVGTVYGTRGWSTGLFDCMSDSNNCTYNIK